MIKNITIESVNHNGQLRVCLKFEKDDEILLLLQKSLTDLKWSATLQCWHIPYSRDVKTKLFQVCRGNYWVDCANFKPLKIETPKNIYVQAKYILPELAPEIEDKIKSFKNYLLAKRYSDNTVEVYMETLKRFLRFHSTKNLSEIKNDDIIDFNINYILKNGLSESFQNQVINSVKLFFRKIQNININVDLIERPRREKKLPNVLSKEEVKSTINSLVNVKHKTMLSLIYSCGLRCGEALRLKPNHVDSKRNILIIQQSKGKKDRIVPLSDKTIEMLRNYYKSYRPLEYLFEGQAPGTQYDQRSLQQVLKKAVFKAGITKPVTLHWLRHSYATHLLEAGTDLRYIQEILGHSSSRTTEIYTHVSTKSIQQIKSPFDDL